MDLTVLISLLAINCVVSTSPEPQFSLLILVPDPQPDLRPLLQPSFNVGPAFYLAAELAADIANQSANILSGYRLNLVRGDSGCNVPFRAIDSFATSLVKSIQNPEASQIVGVVGPACSLSASAVSDVIKHPNITLINIHFAGTQELSDRGNFPYSFGILDSVELLAKASASLVKNANWTEVALFYDSSRLYFTSLMRAISKLLPQVALMDISISTSNFASIENKFRVVFILVPPDLLNRVLCLSYHKHYVLPTYQFILVVDSIEGISPVEFKSGRNSYNCTKSQLVEVVSGSLLINYQVERADNDTITESGISLSDFKEMYQERIAAFNKTQANSNNAIKGSGSIYSMMFFDAVWSFIMTLNASVNTVDLSSYHYGQQNVTDQIREKLLDLDFEGLSGRIKFNSTTGRVQQNASIYIIDEEAKEVRLADYINENIVFVSSHQNYSYTSDQFERAVQTIPKSLMIVMLVVVFLGLLLTLLLNILTFVYRKEKSVKASSVKLSQVAFIGCYINILSIVCASLVFGVPDRLDSVVTCKMQHLLDFSISTGATLLFGAICVRVWRLYRIFMHFNNPGKLSDGFLLMLVGIATVINFLLTLPAFFIDEYEPDCVKVDTSESVVTVIVRCRRRQPFLWTIGSFAVSMILLFTIFTLVVITRKIPQKNFKTKSIFYLSYALTAIIPFSLGVYFVFYSLDSFVYVILRFVILCLSVLSMIYLPCAMLFFPPLFPLLRKHFKGLHYVMELK